MAKSGLFPLYVFLFFNISFAIALAQTGCFLYEGSPYYCQQISFAHAEQECGFSDDCHLSEVFVENQRCEEQSRCHKIYCKSSCQQEFPANCPAGAVPKNQEQEWCSPGCCQVADSCGIKENKWLCEITALNSEKESFQFTILNQEQCNYFCQKSDSPTTTGNSIVNNPLLAVSPEKLPSKGNNSTQEVRTYLEEPFPMLFWFLIIFFLILLFYILLRTKRSQNLDSLRSIPQTRSSFSSSFNPFSKNKTTEMKIKRMQQEHYQKFQKFNRERILASFDTLKGHSTLESHDFKRLKHLINQYQRKHSFSSEEENLFQRLEKLLF